MFKKYALILSLIAAFCVISVTGLGAGQADAYDGGPLQISGFSPYQLLPGDFNVYGLRLAFYGQNFSVYGLDLGVWNRCRGGIYGVGFAGLVSSKQGSMNGVNTSGIINYTQGDEVGWSLAGVINDVDGTLKGLQSTICYNEAKNVKGVQLAMVNSCEKLNGLQLGLVNMCEDQWIPFTIFLNVWFSSEDDDDKKE